jgi:hypothetical protein
MRSLRRAHALAALLALALGGRASAQATRSWVSGVGDDLNPCSRTAPCRTFAGALAKTAAGGEIDALDDGDFDPLTITQGITLDGGPRLAAVLASGTSAITVDAPGAVVVLRNLAIRGDASAPSGVAFVAGAALHVEGCTVSGFGTGIAFEPAAGGRLYAADLQVSGNAEAGIALASGAPAAPAIATVARVRFSRNGAGLRAGANARASIYDAVATDGGTGVAAVAAAGGRSEVNLEQVVLSDNVVGIEAAASEAAVVRLSKVVGLDNDEATRVGAGGRLYSFGNNRLLGKLAPPEPAPGGCGCANPSGGEVAILLALAALTRRSRASPSTPPRGSRGR